MIYRIIFFSFGAACILGAPTDVASLDRQQPTVIPIVSQSEELELNGTYKFSYETGNGIKREETSYDKVLPKATGRIHSSEEGGDSNESDESNEIHVQQGSYSYTAPDGTLITVRYIADENGFRPIGSHLPKPPSPISSSFNAKSGRTLKHPDSTSSESAQSVNVNTEQVVPAIASRSAAESKPAEDKQAETISVASTNSEEPKVTEANPSSGKTPEIVTTPVSQTEPKTEATESSVSQSTQANGTSEIITSTDSQAEAKTEATESSIIPSTQANEISEPESGSGSTPVASELPEGVLKQPDSASSDSTQSVDDKPASELVPAVASSLAAEPKPAEDEPAENTLSTSTDGEPRTAATTLPSAKSSDIATTTSYESEPKTEATESTITSTQSDEIQSETVSSTASVTESKTDGLEEKMESSTQAATAEQPNITTDSTQSVPDASDETSATTLSDNTITEADIIATTPSSDKDETTNYETTDALTEEASDLPSSTEAPSNEEVSTSSSST